MSVRIGNYAYLGASPVGRPRCGVQKFRLHFVKVRRRDRVLGWLIALYALYCALKEKAR